MRAKRKSNDNPFGRCRIGELSTLFISTGARFLMVPVHAEESELAKITGAGSTACRPNPRGGCPKTPSADTAKPLS